jgi:hypothetical protein
MHNRQFVGNLAAGKKVLKIINILTTANKRTDVIKRFCIENVQTIDRHLNKVSELRLEMPSVYLPTQSVTPQGSIVPTSVSINQSFKSRTLALIKLQLTPNGAGTMGPLDNYYTKEAWEHYCTCYATST